MFRQHFATVWLPFLQFFVWSSSAGLPLGGVILYSCYISRQFCGRTTRKSFRNIPAAALLHSKNIACTDMTARVPETHDTIVFALMRRRSTVNIKFQQLCVFQTKKREKARYTAKKWRGKTQDVLHGRWQVVFAAVQHRVATWV
jgi:hypothetical protein